MDQLQFTDEAKSQVESQDGVDDSMRVSGEVLVEAFDSDGNKKWEESGPNLVTNVGLDHVLDVTLSGAAQSSTWYVGLLDGATPTLAAGDTMSSNSWTENTDYDETNRPTWQEGGVSAQSIDNSSNKASYTINAAVTIGGVFLVDDNTKGGTAGLLFAEKQFGSSRDLQSGDTLNVTYTINAS